MKKESTVNRRLAKATRMLANTDGHRIELKTGARGRPDWDFFTNGAKIAFIESKYMYTDRRPLKHWSPPQRTWARNRIKQGFNCFVLMGDETRTLLLDARTHLETQEIIEVLAEWGTTINPAELERHLWKRS